MSEVVIKAENLSKYYKLGVINNGTLFRDIQTWLALKRGKEDPHGQIGSHRYDNDKEGFWALDNLNFEIHQGDRVGIIGHNGAGKSTLLKILSRITAPTEGKVKIKGRVSSLLEVGTGFHGELTGRENIYLNGAILGMKRREVDRKIDEIIAFSEIEKHIDTPVKRYSSGMYVRLAFAVAAHLDSEILIADEVLAVGDAAFQKKALGKMNELSSGQGRTVLFVSHNMAQVKSLCNKGIVLEKGKIINSGKLGDCIRYYLSDSLNIDFPSQKIFEDNERKPFQLKKIQLLDANYKKVTTVESQQELHIQVDFISRQPIMGLYGHFTIKNMSGENVISFDTTEQLSSKLDNLKNGKHIYDITIPKGVFVPGEYILSCNFASRYYDGFNVDSPLECCKLTVVDTYSERRRNCGAMTGIIPNMKEIKIV